VTFPSVDQLVAIIDRTTGGKPPKAAPVVDGAAIVRMGALGLSVPIPTHVTRFVAQVVVATHPDSPTAPPMVRDYVRYGVSPRGAQSLIIGAKLNALLEGRFNVSFEDVQAVALEAMRHRIGLEYGSEVTVDDVVKDVLGATEKMRA
jgi:MoxR-like ATPase